MVATAAMVAMVVVMAGATKPHNAESWAGPGRNQMTWRAVDRSR